MANRGEIAVRIIRALREASIPSVAVFSESDRNGLHVQMADEAICIGPSAASESYLKTGAILAAAKAHQADAIHPGYGFLSENAAFAQACIDAGLTFIGPSPEAIAKMGSKTAARVLAIAAGAPVVPGTERALADTDEAEAVASKIGFPVLLKAAAGGGGKGMREVHRREDLATALRDASSEALRAFGNGEVYIEKLVAEPRHIEIQVLGDNFGHMIHLGERECSLQRRHQKVIEECPSPVMLEHPELRDAMGRAAVSIAKQVGYSNAGTIEFLVDRERNFYFLEMNTRLQVEHPVTELVTGLDLVQWQLRIAAGEPLTLEQEDIRWTGSAMECRLYAEDPDQNYLPSPGRISKLREPSGPGIRLDSGVFEGWNVPLDYDPLLAKLATWAPSRDAAIQRLARALNEYVIGGIRTNCSFFQEILADAQFQNGNLSTAFLTEFAKRRKPADRDAEAEAAAIFAAILASRRREKGEADSAPSRWLLSGRAEQMR